ncbi:MAG: hypothetical protein COS68_07200 [Elusimicrobia bacterium CG06_land_8_20_14_3_00_38_11]|nr:MAG: hypothetical protein COS68_07200 [Elusimicrobia bacterium CG06_land_8_20_14_3_00_38_11]
MRNTINSELNTKNSSEIKTENKAYIRFLYCLTIIFALLSGLIVSILCEIISRYSNFDTSTPFSITPAIISIFVFIVWLGIFIFTYRQSGRQKSYLWLLFFSIFAIWPINVTIWFFILFFVNHGLLGIPFAP